jgi:SAM-dependent methyltransferase
MKQKVLDFLICPTCLPDEKPLRLKTADFSGEEILNGVLECPHCTSAYPIKDGIARVLPVGREVASAQALRYERPDLLSAYLWSHYADLFDDPDASTAYADWAEAISPTGGTGIDVGCATGRFSFEMAKKCDFVIGVDRSMNFIRSAREILGALEFSFSVREEGNIRSKRTFVPPRSWDSRKIEFLVGDAGALPFSSGFFSCVASLNLIDKVPQPLGHLKELNRAARPGNCQLLLSDPFSWSEEASPPESWLGGAPAGSYTGPGIDNIARLLRGEEGLILPSWKVAHQGAVWWKIRNHRNHFELIRSLFVKAER